MIEFDEILKIGVEVEGRWNQLPSRGIPQDEAPIDEDGNRQRRGLMYDGSVEFNGEGGWGNLGHPIDTEGPLIGEAVSDPLRPRQAMEWLRESYPDRVNESCGLHVHMSFPPPYLQWLMDKEFWDYYLREIRAWAEANPVPDHFFDRLQGNNPTCRKRWHPDEQVHGGHDTRYSQWNFHAFRSHGTTECRVFPAFEDVELSVSAVEFVCTLVCKYIRQYEPDPVTIDVKPTRPEPTEEEF